MEHKYDVRMIINKLIENNKEEVLEYLSYKIFFAREKFGKVLNPWELMIFYNIDLYGFMPSNDDSLLKTFLGFDEKGVPYIAFDATSLPNPKLRFLLMMEIQYYLMIKYIIDRKISNIDMNELKNIKFHSINFKYIYEILNDNSFVEKTIRNLAFDALAPRNYFKSFWLKEKNVRRCFEYFGIDEEIIMHYLKEYEFIKEKSKIRTLFKGKK